MLNIDLPWLIAIASFPFVFERKLVTPFWSLCKDAWHVARLQQPRGLWPCDLVSALTSLLRLYDVTSEPPRAHSKLDHSLVPCTFPYTYIQLYNYHRGRRYMYVRLRSSLRPFYLYSEGEMKKYINRHVFAKSMFCSRI